MTRRYACSHILSVGAAALFAVGVQATPASATQAVSGELQANAFGAGVPIDPQTDQWVGAAQLRDLSTQSVYNSPSQSIPNAESHVSMSSHWDSTNSGTVTFSNNGITVNQGARIDDAIFAAYSATWQYRFIADTSGVLEFDLHAAFTGNQVDIGSWQVGAVDVFDPTKLVLQTADGYPSDNNSLELTGSLDLIAGRFYEFDLIDGGDSTNLELPGTIQGNEASTMTWSITQDTVQVSEPASWALLIFGFAMARAMRRGKRRAD
jgi:hypothetical protein